ncbi:flavin reductase family protein [Falsirhodobacter halotolerans]|uniref:flavin reductase family protein n=1 Tax=Falsirhodobacter halotolerans TaxID=1146892 RepID=UPI001FD3730F|nr:flavin reductase family protein [Falsirhodobacter halotolerans]MCJ8139136.1 flavin reductase family protein [Falsirhodobacter halotolerans]
MNSLAFDFAALTPKERYKLLIGTVIPRPIALITTVSAEGLPNAGSFSFFNILTHDPAIMAVGIEYKPCGTPKDTAANILATGEFTVHISDHALVDQMEICSIKFPPDVDELQVAGLETVAGETVRSPRILAAPAAFECHLVQTVPITPARVIVLGEVKRMFVREGLVDPETLHVDQMGIDAVGRLGGHLYARQLDQFERVTPTVEDFMAMSER